MFAGTPLEWATQDLLPDPIWQSTGRLASCNHARRMTFDGDTTSFGLQVCVAPEHALHLVVSPGRSIACRTIVDGAALSETGCKLQIRVNLSSLQMPRQFGTQQARTAHWSGWESSSLWLNLDDLI